MNKQAALTTRQIVILTVLIISFIIILILIFRLNLQETTDKQICHNSVLQRGSSLLSLTDTIPLNCKTHHLCISATNNCNKSRMPRPDDIVKVENKNEVYELLSKEMADCWWMYGEGKVDYVGEEHWFSESMYCSICSLFVFDDSIKEIFPEEKIDENELLNYMIENNYDKDKTYFEYVKGQRIVESPEIDTEVREMDTRKFDVSKNHYIVMGISSTEAPLTSVIVGTVLTVIGVGVTISTQGLGTPIYLAAITGGALLGGTGGYLVGTFIEGDSGNKFLTPTIVETGSEDYDDLNCEDVKSLS